MEMNLEALQNSFPRWGKVEYLSIRKVRVAPVEHVAQVLALKDRGLDGDHYNNPGGGRQVTLIQAEHLSAIAKLLAVEHVSPSLTRRNIVVSGINLLALKGKQFRIGDAVLQWSGECHPCSRMEKSLGAGGYNSMRGHGGITARVIQSGKIKIGDDVCVLMEHTKH